MDFQLNKRWTWNINYQYVDKRKDAYFDGNTYATENVVLNSYQLLNSLVQYELVKDKLTVFGAATNIFNEEFVENIGYNTRGRNFRLGINIKL